MTARNAPVAQLDRALPSGGRGQGFESLRARHIPHEISLLHVFGAASEPSRWIGTLSASLKEPCRDAAPPGQTPEDGGHPVKIAIMVDRFPVISETFILNQITGLLDLGHDVHVIADARSDGRPHPDVHRYGLLNRTHVPEIPEGARNRISGALRAFHGRSAEDRGLLLRSTNPIRWGREGLSLELLFRCLHHLDSEYDIIHCHFGHNGNRAAKLKAIGATRAKVVTTFHGRDIRRAAAEGPGVWPHLRRHGDRFLAISRHSREVLLSLEFPADRIVQQPVGIELEKFPFRARSRAADPTRTTVRILSVGRLVWEKAHDVGLRAVKLVLERNPGWKIHYTIVGEGRLREATAATVRDLGLEGVVELAGALDEVGVAAAMADADIFMLPSIAEVLPLALMEALATGLPVVATRVGAISEIIQEEDTGYLAPPGDPVALASQLERLLSHPERHAEMGRLGRASIEEHFDVSRLNRRLVEIYQSI